MTFEPLLTAPFQVQLHVIFALIAICLGPFALYRTRRDVAHKISGYVWVTAMVGLAVTGLFIRSDFPVVGRFGPIHLLCVFALWGCYEGIRQIRRKEIARHQATMKSLWYGAIGVTGLLTLLPGRTLNRVLFGAPSEAGFLVIAFGSAGLLWLYLSQRKRMSYRTP